MNKKNDLDKKIKGIEEVYDRYLNKLRKLKLEQDEIVVDFIKELESKKIEEYKKSINF